jgi:hypothetical protein
LPAKKGIKRRRRRNPQRVVIVKADTPLELLSSSIGKRRNEKRRWERGSEMGQLEEGASFFFPSSLLFCPEDGDSKFL